jgi:hypothetical protein
MPPCRGLLDRCNKQRTLSVAAARKAGMEKDDETRNESTNELRLNRQPSRKTLE